MIDKFNVNMNGTQYLDYVKWKKQNSFKFPKISENQVVGLSFIILSVLLVFLATILINNYFFDPPITAAEKAKNQVLSEKAVNLSWNDLAKISFVNYGFIIIVMLLIAWIVHGVGFYIIR